MNRTAALALAPSVLGPKLFSRPALPLSSSNGVRSRIDLFGALEAKWKTRELKTKQCSLLSICLSKSIALMMIMMSVCTVLVVCGFWFPFLTNGMPKDDFTWFSFLVLSCFEVPNLENELCASGERGECAYYALEDLIIVWNEKDDDDGEANGNEFCTMKLLSVAQS